MTTPTDTSRGGAALIGYLERLAEREERGPLADLRRGLGKVPGTAPEMFPHVERHYERGAPPEAYVVASLFGLHYHHARKAGADAQTLGHTLRQIRFNEAGEEDQGVARRFAALLDAGEDAVPHHLRQLIALFGSRKRDAPIDYLQLYYDLRGWDSLDRHVQKLWASGFWGAQPRPTDEDATSAPTTSDDSEDDRDN